MNTPDKTIPWEDVAAIRSGDLRKEVFVSIGNDPRCASAIASEMSVSRQVVTNHLHYLRDRGLARCLTPDRPHHRIYGITQQGKKVFDAL